MTFPPKFTYPIFGDAEQVFGYQGLRIDLAFDCLSMKPLLTYRYSKKLDDGGNVKPIEETLGKFLPAGDFVFGSETEWADAVAAEAFVLPAEQVVRSYERSGRMFDVYKFEDLAKDSLGRRLLGRIQVLTLLYIEAGSYIDADDAGWTLYVVYERAADKPVFVGFCTCYKYWLYSPEHDARAPFAESQYRARLSQMVVLPPFQGAGHGQELYKTVAGADGEWERDARCVEITVEDPTDQFDELRDRCDLERALAGGLLRQIGKIPLSGPVRRDLRRKWKLTPRQFDRVIEMGLLWLLEHKEGSWIEGLRGEQSVRLLVKRRIYMANREGLVGLGDDRLAKSKLEEVWTRVARDHRRVALSVERPLKRERED